MTHPPNPALLSAALDAAGHGWPVFPLRPGGKRPALHGEERCPRTGPCSGGHIKWEQRATTDPNRVRRCWAAGAFNVGIATGPARLVVVDLDMPKSQEADMPDGMASFQALCERAGHAVPATRTVRTARGGRHLYFTAPNGTRLGNTAGRLAPLIDTRAHGGYVVAPGSTTPTGTYTVVDDAPTAVLPGWLLGLLAAGERPVDRPPVRIAAAGGRRCAVVALERETSAVASTAEGGRNAQLLASVRAVGRFVAWGDLPRPVVEEAFQEAGEAAGLPPAECRATIRSALNWSLRTARPRETA